MFSACPRETDPVGQRGSGWGQRLEASNWWRFPEGSEVGSRETLVSWVPFLAAAEAVEASASRPLRCGLPGSGQHWEREASHLSWAGRCPGPGPSEQDAQGEQGQQEQQRAWGGAA